PEQLHFAEPDRHNTLFWFRLGSARGTARLANATAGVRNHPVADKNQRNLAAPFSLRSLGVAMALWNLSPMATLAQIGRYGGSVHKLSSIKTINSESTAIPVVA